MINGKFRNRRNNDALTLLSQKELYFIVTFRAFLHEFQLNLI